MAGLIPAIFVDKCVIECKVIQLFPTICNINLTYPKMRESELLS